MINVPKQKIDCNIGICILTVNTVFMKQLCIILSQSSEIIASEWVEMFITTESSQVLNFKQ